MSGWRVKPGRGIMHKRVVYYGGQVLPSDYIPDESHKSGGDVVYFSGEVEKPTVAAIKAIETPDVLVTTEVEEPTELTETEKEADKQAEESRLKRGRPYKN
jgi:hypothetical protein